MISVDSVSSQYQIKDIENCMYGISFSFDTISNNRNQYKML